jgi:macrolide transport system ATP-binding/permease protein
MNLCRQIFSKLRYLFARHGPEQDFDDEINTHVTLLADRFFAQGMTKEKAWYAARRQFGSSMSLKEARNEMQTFVWLETLWQDLRHGVRVLGKNRGFAAVAVLTLALGIGANTAIFSVVNAAILRPLPYPDPGRLVTLWGNVKRVRVERRGASYPDYRDWRDQSRSFQAMAAFEDAQLALTGIATPERIPCEYVSQPYFSLLGIHAAAGRTFRPEEDLVPERDAVVVLSDGTWKRRFGGDPGIVGRTIQLDGRTYTIVGVAPPGFHGLTDEAEAWIPFLMAGSAADFNERGTRGFRVLARLKSGVSLAQTQAEMDAISNGLAQTYPATNEARGVEISPLEQETLGDVRKPLLVLLAAVGFVLLIASTNVANLLLARSEGRQHEVAMRAALGASRGRLLRQLLAESAVLVAFGCLAGLVLAHYGIRALMAASPLRFPSTVHPTIDAGVGLFTVLVCCAVGLALGLAPAAQLRTAGFDEALKQGALRSTGGRRGHHFRDALVVAEISLSLLLLIGAGLMIRSLRHLAALNPGYDPSHVVNIRVSLPQLQPSNGPDANANPDMKVVVAASNILRRLSTLPSVESASIATDAPLTGGNAIFYAAEGQPAMNAQATPRAYFHRVSPDFFHTLHTRLLAGRRFTEDEIHGNANVAIVTENMVKRFWPGQDPIGKRIKVGGLDSSRPWLTIVGVVEELRYRGLPGNPTSDPDLFQVFNERSRDFSVLVRTSLEPSAMLAAIRTTLTQTVPSILIYNAGTLQALVGRETARPRFTGWLMAIFAGIALVLAMIGVYGVMSYSVSRRTREIGLRMALGAGRRDVLRMVAGRGVALVTLGMLLGTAAALVLTRTMATLIYGVSSTDPLTFATASAMLAAVAMVACLLPAFRATRIDPAIALRDE